MNEISLSNPLIQIKRPTQISIIYRIIDRRTIFIYFLSIIDGSIFMYNKPLNRNQDTIRTINKKNNGNIPPYDTYNDYYDVFRL